MDGPPPKTLKSLLKQAGLTVDQLLNLLFSLFSRSPLEYHNSIMAARIHRLRHLSDQHHKHIK
ncbi:MAG: hypothetical protein ACPLPT_00425 [Moorellales bacterium]